MQARPGTRGGTAAGGQGGRANAIIAWDNFEIERTREVGSLLQQQGAVVSKFNFVLHMGKVWATSKTISTDVEKATHCGKIRTRRGNYLPLFCGDQ